MEMHFFPIILHFFPIFFPICSEANMLENWIVRISRRLRAEWMPTFGILFPSCQRFLILKILECLSITVQRCWFSNEIVSGDQRVGTCEALWIWCGLSAGWPWLSGAGRNNQAGPVCAGRAVTGRARTVTFCGPRYRAASARPKQARFVMSLCPANEAMAKSQGLRHDDRNRPPISRIALLASFWNLPIHLFGSLVYNFLLSIEFGLLVSGYNSLLSIE